MEDVHLSTAGLRPYRKGGIRLEEENIRNKTVFHNYGHGGAGVSMSYGCAMLATIRMMSRFPTKYSPNVAILGSGYMGLFTAKLLAERGYSVKIYTNEIPGEKKRGA